MAESKVHRLRIRQGMAYSTESETGRKYVHLSQAENSQAIPKGYRVVSASWFIEEDSPANVTMPKGQPQIYPDATGVFFDYTVTALPAIVRFEVVVERSDEPDVVIELGTQIN